MVTPEAEKLNSPDGAKVKRPETALLPGESTIKTPPKWGHDRLSKFVSDAFNNSLATFVRKHQVFRVLERIDANFLSIVEAWTRFIATAAARLFASTPSHPCTRHLPYLSCRAGTSSVRGLACPSSSF